MDAPTKETGMLESIIKKMDQLRAARIQGLPVFRLTVEQYDALAADLTARGAKHGFEGRPPLMVHGAKVELQ